MRFYFDFISPYAYLAWTQLPAIAERHGRTLEPVPILFAALLGEYGHKGPAEIPPKRLYVFKDVVRRAGALGVPLQPPPGHPFNPLLALRVVEAAAAERRAAIIDALFGATWAEAEPRGVDRPETVAHWLEQTGDAPLLERATDPEVKDRVRANTQRAIDAGVFGVPTVEVDGEIFWGTDSLPYLEGYLRGEDPVSEELLARWRDLPANATR